MSEPSCADYQPPKAHEFVLDESDDRGALFGQVAYCCRFCSAIDWRWE